MNACKTFGRSESGAASILSLFLIFMLVMVAGFAIDVQNLMTARTRMQTAVDSAAHAALLSRESMTAEESQEVAVRVAMANMPEGRYGATVEPEDVIFGRWDAASHSFTADPDSRSAVTVLASRVDERENSIPTFLLHMVGFDRWQVVQSAIFTTYYPTCLREGFVANGVVDLQSNNTYTNGFCIHSNQYVSLNSNNTFEPGTVVSMSNLDDLELPNSGYKTNVGLEQALREGSWNIRIVPRIEKIVAQLERLEPEVTPDYISGSFRTLPDNRVSDAELEDGFAYRYTCGSGGNGTLTIDNDVLIRRNVIVTDCRISFNNGVQIQDSVIVSKSRASNALNSSSGLVIGKDDGCAAGGGAQLVTLGGMKFTSDLHIYGSQLLALGDIEFSANAEGVEGAAMVAGGTISGTSNMNMGFCGTGMEDNFQASYFKLVQ